MVKIDPKNHRLIHNTKVILFHIFLTQMQKKRNNVKFFLMLLLKGRFPPCFDTAQHWSRE